MALRRHYGLTFYQLLSGMSIHPAHFCELFSVDNRRIQADAPVFCGSYKYKNAALRNIFAAVENELLVMHSMGKLKVITDKMLKSHLEEIISGRKKSEKSFIDYLDCLLYTSPSPRDCS